MEVTKLTRVGVYHKGGREISNAGRKITVGSKGVDKMPREVEVREDAAKGEASGKMEPNGVEIGSKQEKIQNSKH